MIKPIEQQVQVSDDALLFVRAMIAGSVWDEDVVASFLEKPWKWDEEWTLWLEWNRPYPGETDFARYLDALDNLTLDRNTR